MIKKRLIGLLEVKRGNCHNKLFSELFCSGIQVQAPKKKIADEIFDNAQK
jgi:hypothetical protein